MAYPPADSLQDDQRREARHRSLLGAKLVYGDGAYTIDCVMRDLSITPVGARVKVPDGQVVPDHVYLLEVRSGVAYESKVIWKRHPEIGLEFLKSYNLAGTPETPLLQILKELWTETRERAGI